MKLQWNGKWHEVDISAKSTDLTGTTVHVHRHGEEAVKLMNPDQTSPFDLDLDNSIFDLESCQLMSKLKGNISLFPTSPIFDEQGCYCGYVQPWIETEDRNLYVEPKENLFRIGNLFLEEINRVLVPNYIVAGDLYFENVSFDRKTKLLCAYDVGEYRVQPDESLRELLRLNIETHDELMESIIEEGMDRSGEFTSREKNQCLSNLRHWKERIASDYTSFLEKVAKNSPTIADFVVDYAKASRYKGRR